MGVTNAALTSAAGPGWYGTTIGVDSERVHHITITATGPFDQVPVNSYEIDLSQYSGQPARGRASLHGITKAIQELGRGRQ